MGANAQTSVPAFTAGQVLTAQQQTEINTGIPVFATTTTRDAAFGGTGEKVLAEGQMAYIENIAGSSAVQYYDGAAWATLVTGGLTLISTTTIGTTVSSVTVSNVFSSTYDNYRIIISGGTGTVADELLNLTLGATATGYNASYVGTSYSSTTNNNTTDNNTTAWSRFAIIRTDGLIGTFDLIGPNLAKNTYIVGAQLATSLARFGAGFLNNTTQYTGFTLTAATGTVTGGTIRVYGYQNS